MDFNTETNPRDPNEPVRETSEASNGGSSTEFNLSEPINSFVATVRAIALVPVAFYSGMSRRGDYLSPLAFSLICFEILALAGGVVGFIGALIDPSTGFFGALGSFLLLVLLTPVVGTVLLFFSAAIYHLVVYLLVKPSASGFETTFRILAYSSVAIIPLAAVALVAWIPLVGPVLNIVVSLAATGYALFLAVVGIREAHETTTGKAILVMVIPTAVSVLILLLLILVGAGAVFFFTR